MKPSFQHLGFDSVEGSFLCYLVSSPKFGFHWHYHPECEISYVIRGRGTRLVGDNVNEFKEGDLLFLGPDLPHTLISDEVYMSKGKNMDVLVIQFPKEIIDQRSVEISELSSIGKLIEKSSRGISFNNEKSDGIGSKMERLTELKGFHRYHLLLEILHDLAIQDGEFLASEFYTPNRSNESEERLSKVCTYIHENFTEDIHIATLASLAVMNEAAFCRFFKKMTGKSALTYINDLRIGQACQLLISESITISEAAYQSGFNSITHFNRSFIKRKGTTPTNTREKQRPC